MKIYELRTKPHWSYTALNTYLNVCQLQYFFRYIEQAEVEQTSACLLFGKAFHAALSQQADVAGNGSNLSVDNLGVALTGVAGSGKGLIANMIQKAIGLNNCTELRAPHLTSRFETGRYIDKTLIYGPDVPSDFLYRRSASYVKSLCGGDMMTSELKGVQQGTAISGRFNIIITSNGQLRLPIDYDSDAWRRRLLWICFERPAVQNRIPHFDDILIREEGPGILNWMIEGARLVLKDGIPVPETMNHRIDDLLRASNSVYGFIAERVERSANPDAVITANQLYSKYSYWCDENKWTPDSERCFQNKAKHMILARYSISQSHDIKWAGSEVRGYRGLKILR